MKTPPSYRMKTRMVMVLAAMIVFGFCVVIHSLFQIQIVQGAELQERALGQQMRTERIGAKRGDILDTNGKALAKNSTIYQICVSPGDLKIKVGENADKMKEKRSAVIKCLEEILGCNPDTVAEALDNTASFYVVVKKKVEQDDYQRLMQEVNAKDLKNVIFGEEMTWRRYPYGSLASTVLGFTNNDNVGAAGLESYYEKTLAGTPGRIVSLRTQGGAVMPMQYEQTYDAKNGNTLVLTIDEQIQHYLEKNLEIAVSEHRVKNRVTGIIMDVETAAILAMTTKPDFDPNDPYTITDPDWLQQIQEAQEESFQQESVARTEEERAAAKKIYTDKLWVARNTLWRNKAVSDPYEPGSVFKIMTLSTALETGAATVNSHYNCIGYVEVAGRKIHCHVWNSRHSGHGDQDLTQATMNSCNPAFIRIGQSIGTARFSEYFSNFGLTQGTDIDLPGEANSIYHARLSDADLASSAFGQTNKLTPIQLITACCAAVNGGKLMQPYVVKQVVDSDGNVVSNTASFVKRQVISEKTSEEVRGILEKVVSEGSGRQARIPGYRIGGKTGTSEKLDQADSTTGDIPHILSFFGFAPADDPKVACLVLLDEPDVYNAWGSTIAAPIVGSILSDVLPHMGIEPQYTAEELDKMTNQVPYLINFDLHDAESELRIRGMRYRVIGSGSKVLQQIPGAMETLPEEGSVVLYTDEVQEDNVIEVPNVVGKSPEEANSTLAGLGLNVYMNGGKLEGVASIAISQSPEAGARVPSGSVITVEFTERDPAVENTLSADSPEEGDGE